jgi:hypothetical protein
MCNTADDSRKDFEKTLQQLLAAVLVFVGSISFTVLGSIKDSENSSADEVFGVIGLASLFAAVAMIDGICDGLDLKLGDRLNLLNYRYLFFSMVVGLMFAGILILYVNNSHLAKGWKGWISVATAVPVAACVTMALMVLNGSLCWCIGAFAWIILFITWHIFCPVWQQTKPAKETATAVHSVEGQRLQLVSRKRQPNSRTSVGRAFQGSGEGACDASRGAQLSLYGALNRDIS